MVEEFVERGVDGASGEEHVIDQDDVGVIHVKGDEGGGEFLGDGVTADVIAVKRDVDGAYLRGFEAGSKAAGEFDAAIGNAEEDKFLFVRPMMSTNGIGELVDGLMKFVCGQGR